MTRIACLLIPLFPLAARLRAEPELAGEAVAVCEGNGSAARVLAASRPARSAGVRSGMSLAQARGILPTLIARSRDLACEGSAHEALLETAACLSPRVEDANPDLVFGDVSDMQRLYDSASGEQEMGQAAVAAAEALDLPVRIGIAGNKLAARIAARLPDTPTVVSSGEEARFLAPLPLAHLKLEQRLVDTLKRWGVRTLGDLARLPADRTASRLGPAGASAHRAARGIDSSPLAPYHLPPTLCEGMELEWPVVTVDPLLFALRQSLERTRHRLQREDLSCALLELELGLEPEGAEHRMIRLPAPTRDIDALLALIRLELESHPPRAPVTSFRCVTHPDRPRRGQLTLFGAPDISPDELAGTLARLAARVGPDRVGSPCTVDGHLPERYATVPFDPPPAPKLRQPPRQGRGLLAVRVLRPPVPLEVITEENSEFGTRRRQRRWFKARPKEEPVNHPLTAVRHGARRAPVIRNSELPHHSFEGASEQATKNPPTAAVVVQGSSEGGANEPPAGGGASRRPQGASNPPTAAVVVQGSSEGGANEPPAGGGASRRPQGASNSKLKTQNSKLPGSLRLVSIASEPGAAPRIQGLVRVAAGPWTLEEGWWNATPVERDYWDVELGGGRLYRIYRERTTGDWFADGMYD